jgi:hypothetical protein
MHQFIIRCYIFFGKYPSCHSREGGNPGATSFKL